MGVAQVKAKTKETKSLVEPPKVTITIQFDAKRQIPIELTQLTNWSLSQIQNVYQTFHRIAQCPMLSRFLFKKIMPSSKNNSDIMFNLLAQGEKFISVYEVIGLLVLASYQTYRKKFQFLSLIFDFQSKGFINGRQFLLSFYSVLYGYCRLTQHKLPRFDIVQRFGQASYFPDGEETFDEPVSFRKYLEEYDGNNTISEVFNRFERVQFRQIKQNSVVFSRGQFGKYSKEQIIKNYRIIDKAYAKKNFEEVQLIEQNLQLRMQNRRDSCYRELIEQKNSIFQSQSFLKGKKSQSLHKLSTNQRESNGSINKLKIEEFRIKKMQSSLKTSTPHKKKLIFLNGHTHSKDQIFQTITYFKRFAQKDDKISIKQFFKRFENQAYMKKQLSSIFKYLDQEKKGEISLNAFFKAFYPGITQSDLQVLNKWHRDYQQIYEVDSLARNQAKVTVMSDARELPYDTYQRIKQIFMAMDIGNKGFLNYEDIRKSYRQGHTGKQIELLLKQHGDGQKMDIKGLCKMLLPKGWKIEGVEL